MTNKTEIGLRGENLACEFLVRKKYKILKRNYREKFDEIDIIARAINGTLVFCEVKTLSQKVDFKNVLTPEDNMTKEKIKKIKRSSEMFVGKHQDLIIEKVGWQIDCIVVVINEEKGSHELRHYENI